MSTELVERTNRVIGQVENERNTMLDIAGRMFSEFYNSGLVYNPETKTWYLWNGSFHAEHDEFDVVDALMDLILVMRRHVATAWGYQNTLSPNAQSNLKLASSLLLRLETPVGQREFITQLQTIATRRKADWESARDVTVFSDGWVLDIAATKALGGSEVVLREPDPNRLVIRTMNATYRPGVIPEGVTWVQDFLAHVLADAQSRRYFLQMVGASVFGDVHKHIPNLVGKRDSFKSRVLKALDYVFGGYAGTVNASAFSRANPNFYRTEFAGRRFTWVSDPSIERVDNEFFLSLTAGEELHAARKGTKDLKFYPEGNIFIASNKVINFNAAMPELNTRMDVLTFAHNCRTECQYSSGLDATNEKYADAWLYLAMNAYLPVIGKEIKAPHQANMTRYELASKANSAVRWLVEVEEAEEYSMQIDDIEMTPEKEYVPIPVAHADYIAWCERVRVPIYEQMESSVFAEHVRSQLGTEVCKKSVRSPLWVDKDGKTKPTKVLLGLKKA